jgi:trans-2-enoyl-CoA reductase
MFSFSRSSLRHFSSSARVLSRAVVYSQNGDPSKVLRILTYPSIPSPPPNSVNVKFLLSPINPADINVIEGVYPSKPAETDALVLSNAGGEANPTFVGGNEGLARVTAVGEGVHSLAVDDWVIMIKQQAGTWATDRTVTAADVAKVPDSQFLTEAQAATITVSVSRRKVNLA